MDPQLLFLIPLLPLAAAAVNMVLGRRLPRSAVIGLAVGGVGLSTVATLVLWPLSAGEGTRTVLYTWLSSGDLQIPVELLFDRLSASMALMVTFVSTLIHLYAVGYMEEDRDTTRFFALLNLFVFSMLTIVLSDNLLLLFLGWEGVGFCSYGLIGFWYRKDANAEAGRKAFIVTRVGDVFLGIALLWLFALTGTLSLSEINAAAASLPPETVTLLVLLLLAGACGKSAQLPLMTWLPDAMAGPTPVSALIHAATMVTAGVYLLSRLFPLVSLSSIGMAAIAIVGALTALYTATCAMAQTEIKKVLAYSTMSQVGFMFLAVGAGSVAGAMFHLFTHAFFKALLFMGAGGVIHLTGGENDIFRMGGLARKDRIVFWSFLAGALCLAGAPLTGGFFSKDAILATVFAVHSPLYKGLWALAVLTALLTAFYTFRLVYLVFAGEPRSGAAQGGHHLPSTMHWTLIPLAILGLFGGLLNLPEAWGGTQSLARLLGPLAGEAAHASLAVEWGLAGLATFLFVLGWVLARWRYLPAPSPRYGAASRFFLQGWQADRLVEWTVLKPFRGLAHFFWKVTDRKMIDGFLEGLAQGSQSLGEMVRKLTTGRIHTYLTALAIGLIFILGWFLWQIVLIAPGLR